MSSKYIDTTAVMQVIGCVYNDPSLLDVADAFIITDEDFEEDFHRIIYGSIYKLHELGANTITLEAINDFLETKPKRKAIFDLNRGNEYLQKISQIASPLTFKYYYDRLKKMSLLRAYDNFGLDVSFLYDPDNIFDTKKKESQEEWLDNSSLETIALAIEEKIQLIRESYVDENVYGASYEAGDGIEDLILRFEQVPDVGVPLYGNYINTITRGARLGKFYLRSAPTGVGKTRSMIADACYIACNKI
jgi:replicative DNA helicase